MKFYKLTHGKDIDYRKLYGILETFGGFVIDKNTILFYCKRLNKKIFKDLDVDILQIDASTYDTNNVIVKEWLISNFRKFRVEKLLKEAEVEKQDDIKHLYEIIKSASDIIDRKEDIDAEEQ